MLERDETFRGRGVDVNVGSQKADCGRPNSGPKDPNPWNGTLQPIFGI